MNLLRNRPLATCCMVFLLALTVAANTDSLTKLWLGGAAVFFLLLPAIVLKSKRRRLPVLAPLCLLLSLLALLDGYLQFDRRFQMAEDYTGEVTICARVREITYTNGSALGFTADCETVNGTPDNRRVTVWAYTDLLPAAGDRVTLRAELLDVSEEDSLFLYLRARGISAQAEDVFDLTITEATPRAGDRLRTFFADLRSGLGAHLSRHVPGNGGALMRALLLGEQHLLPDTITRDCRRTGISHVLSLSGLHISLLVGALATLCRRLRCPRYATLLGQIVLVLFYMALTGFSVSIIRAGMMTLLFSLSFFARREADGITSLSLAAVLIALFSPTAVYDCGYWLSVVATFGILARNEWRQTKQKPTTLPARIVHGVMDSLCVTLAATFATLPLVAIFFGEISLLTPLCNLLLIPLFNLYLLLAVLTLALGPIPGFGALVGMLGELLLSLVSWAASLRGILLSLDYTPVKLLLLILAAIVFVCLCATHIGRKRMALIGLVGISVIALFLGIAEIHRTTASGVYYSHTGTNEILLLQDGNRGLLCDLTNGSYTAQKNGLHAIDRAHLTELEGYLITHYHARHVRSLSKVCGQILLRTLYLPIPTSEDEEKLYRALTAEAASLGVTCVLYKPYEDIPFGDMTIHPHAQGKSQANHPTVAISMRHGDQLLTYLGAGHHESDQAEQAASAVAKSSLLIFGLHGGREESRPDFSTFSSSLSEVVLPNADRLTPSLAAFLEARLRLAEEGAFSWIDL